MTITQTPRFLTRIVGPIEAEVPSDGGRWALLCEHYEDGEWLNAAIIQDSNKRRLAGWKNAKRGAGYTDWCGCCQEAAQGGEI